VPPKQLEFNVEDKFEKNTLTTKTCQQQVCVCYLPACLNKIRRVLIDSGQTQVQRFAYGALGKFARCTLGFVGKYTCG
jgi:hypothetical protein